MAKKSCELRGQRKDGSIFDIYQDCRLIKSEDGLPLLHMTLTDLTVQKRSMEVRHTFEKRIQKLTRREREVLLLALSGALNRDIATKLQINQRTVENHRARIYKKTGVMSLLELTQQATNAEIYIAEILTPSTASPKPRLHDNVL